MIKHLKLFSMLLLAFVVVAISCKESKTNTKTPEVSEMTTTAVNVIKERQNEFGGIKDNMSAIGKAVKAGATDKETIEKNAKEMSEHFIALKTLFPEDSQKGLTDANAQVWKDAEGFQNALDYSASTANALAVAVQTNEDITAAFKKVDETCKSCHKEYRKPKDQSYKKR